MGIAIVHVGDSFTVPTNDQVFGLAAQVFATKSSTIRMPGVSGPVIEINQLNDGARVSGPWQ